jgi:hypothetical protein
MFDEIVAFFVFHGSFHLRKKKKLTKCNPWLETRVTYWRISDDFPEDERLNNFFYWILYLCSFNSLLVFNSAKRGRFYTHDHVYIHFIFAYHISAHCPFIVEIRTHTQRL